MPLFSLLQRLFRYRSRRSALCSRPRRDSCLLTLEVLEDRLAPAIVTRIWTGTGIDQNWTTAANWTNGAPKAGDNLVFGSVADTLKQPINDFSFGTHFHSITFKDSGYFVSGNPIMLSGGIRSTSAVSGPDTVNLDLILVNPQTFKINGANADVELQGGITGVARIGLIKSGSGTLGLGAGNTYPGGTTVRAGTLVVENDQALGTGKVRVKANASLVLTGTSLANSLTLTGKGVDGGGALQINGNNYTVNGKVVLAGATTVNVGFGELILANRVSGRGHLTEIGFGTLTLAGANTYRGGTTVAAGTLQVTNTTGKGTGSGPVTVNSGGFIGGNGSVGALATNFNTTVSPGVGFGQTGILKTGPVALSSFTTYQVDLNGTTPGIGFDQLNVTGTVNLAHANLQFSDNFASQPGDTFVIVKTDPKHRVISNFIGLPEGTTFQSGSGIFTIHYNAGNGKGVVLVQTGATPTSSIDFPVNGGSYNATTWTGTITGTASATPPADVAIVFVNIQDTTTHQYWDGTAFNNAFRYVQANGTTNWSYPLNASNLTPGDNYAVQTFAIDTDGRGQNTLSIANFNFTA